jgi:hypothetical protein
MKESQDNKRKRNYLQLESQRKAMRQRLYRMIDELEGRPVDRRKYQPFPIGVLEKVIENRLQGLEDLVRRLVIAVEKRMSKP